MKILYFICSISVALIIGLWVIGGSGMEIQKSTTINASSGELWTLLTDSEQLKKWNPDIIEDTPISGDSLQVGSKSKLLMKEGNGTAEYESEILNITTEKKLDMSLTGKPLGKSPMFVSYEIDRNGETSEIRYKTTWKPKEFWLRLLSPMIKMMANKNADQAMSNLKQLAEK